MHSSVITSKHVEYFYTGSLVSSDIKADHVLPFLTGHEEAVDPFLILFKL